MKHTTLLRRRPDLVLPEVGRGRLRDEAGATTAEYATVTGAAVGFGALLWKFLTSEAGQAIVKAIFDWVLGMIGL